MHIPIFTYPHFLELHHKPCYTSFRLGPANRTFFLHTSSHSGHLHHFLLVLVVKRSHYNRLIRLFVHRMYEFHVFIQECFMTTSMYLFRSVSLRGNETVTLQGTSNPPLYKRGSLFSFSEGEIRIGVGDTYESDSDGEVDEEYGYDGLSSFARFWRWRGFVDSV